MQLQEPKARESLLTPSMRRSASKTSLSTTETANSNATSNTLTTNPSSPSVLSIGEKSVTSPYPASELSPLPHVKAANAALMERTPFAIDDAGDDDDENFDDAVEDDDVMNEVRIFENCQA